MNELPAQPAGHDPTHRARAVLRWLLAAFFSAAGLAHLVAPDQLLAITPSWVPFAPQVIFLTGLFEFAASLALLTKPLRRHAGIALALYALCVWPANFKHAIYGIELRAIASSWWYHAPRLALQPVIIWWALFASGAIDWPFRRRLEPADHGAVVISAMQRPLLLAAFIIIVLGGGTLIGLQTIPGDWYAGLRKPFFNPPNWIFAPVWSVLYIAIAVAGWRVFTRGNSRAAMALWTVQLALNFSWSPVFFRAHHIDFALAIIAVLLLAIIGFIAVTWRRDRASALLFLPYAVWVAFATLLNAAIWRLN